MKKIELEDQLDQLDCEWELENKKHTARITGLIFSSSSIIILTFNTLYYGIHSAHRILYLSFWSITLLVFICFLATQVHQFTKHQKAYKKYQWRREALIKSHSQL
jgi:hypothetical protein